MDFQIVILLTYLFGLSVAVWYIQFRQCLRRFEESDVNPVPQSMWRKYYDSKKHDTPANFPPTSLSGDESMSSDEDFEAMKAQLHSYLSRYPRILGRYMEAETEEERETILNELRHCEPCASDNIECHHNQAEADGAVLPEDLAPLPLTPELH